MQGVYAWVNTVNGKVYVGSATNVARRKRDHTTKLNSRKHSNSHLQSAWLKYGSTSFEFELLEKVNDLIWLRAREQAWITRLQACDREFGYNVTTDAWSPVSSPETVAKLKKAWVARKERGDYYKFTSEDQEKSRQASTGKPWSEKKRKLLMRTRKAGWTPERRAAQAKRLHQQKLNDPTMASRGGVKGAASRWAEVN